MPFSWIGAAQGAINSTLGQAEQNKQNRIATQAATQKAELARLTSDFLMATQKGNDSEVERTYANLLAKVNDPTQVAEIGKMYNSYATQKRELEDAKRQAYTKNQNKYNEYVANQESDAAKLGQRVEWEHSMDPNMLPTGTRYNLIDEELPPSVKLDRDYKQAQIDNYSSLIKSRSNEGGGGKKSSERDRIIASYQRYLEHMGYTSDIYPISKFYAEFDYDLVKPFEEVFPDYKTPSQRDMADERTAKSQAQAEIAQREQSQPLIGPPSPPQTVPAAQQANTPASAPKTTTSQPQMQFIEPEQQAPSVGQQVAQGRDALIGGVSDAVGAVGNFIGDFATSDNVTNKMDQTRMLRRVESQIRQNPQGAAQLLREEASKTGKSLAELFKGLPVGVQRELRPHLERNDNTPANPQVMEQKIRTKAKQMAIESGGRLSEEEAYRRLKERLQMSN